jgi:Flp pilus assembly pilin Flp
VRARRGDLARPHPGRRLSRGATSVEYGLLIAVIGGMLCLGIGATIQGVFEGTLTCFIAQFQSGGTSSECPGTTPGGRTPGGDVADNGADNGADPKSSPAPGTSPSPSPAESPDPSRSPSPSVSPSPSPTESPSPDS